MDAALLVALLAIVEDLKLSDEFPWITQEIDDLLGNQNNDPPQTQTDDLLPQ